MCQKKIKINRHCLHLLHLKQENQMIVQLKLVPRQLKLLRQSLDLCDNKAFWMMTLEFAQCQLERRSFQMTLT